MRLLGTVMLGLVTAALIDCGGDSTVGGAANGTPPDGSVADAATGDTPDAANGGNHSGGSSNAGSTSQGGDDGGADPTNPDACPDTANDAVASVGDSCSGSDVCVFSDTHLTGECDGTYVLACTSGTWASQCFAENANGDGGPCTDLDAADAGPLRVCSESLGHPVLWGPGDLPSGVPSCGPIPLQVGCMLPWGCNAFDDARTALARCDGGAFVHSEHSAKGFGFLILEDHLGLVVRRGYYDETTGELVGAWIREGLEESCDGTVPRDSFTGPTTNNVPLCLPDGGAFGDSGALGDGG
jgi:hypothetical protein